MYLVYCGLICIQLNVGYHSFVIKMIVILVFLNSYVFSKILKQICA